MEMASVEFGTIVAKTLAFRTLIAENLPAMFGDRRRDALFGETLYERKKRRAQEAGQPTGCIFVLLLLGLGGWNIYQAALAWESTDWQKTRGLVVSSRSVPGIIASLTTYAEVEYTYTVKEQRYKSQNLHWGSAYRLTRAGAAEEVARYPVGAEVEVYYDPDAPSDAVLERGFNRHFALDVVLSLIVIGLAFLIMNVVFEQAAWERMKYDSS